MANTIANVSKVSFKDSYVSEYFSHTPWMMCTLNGVKISENDNSYTETKVVNLSDRSLLYVYPGTKLVLKVELGDDIYTTNTLIEYAPDSDLTAYFEFIGEFDKKTYLKYLGSW